MPISRTKKAKMKTTGINESKINILASTKKEEAIINNNICPANIFANNRMAKLNGLIMKDKISIIINKGINQVGIPLGKKILKNCNFRFFNPTIIQATKKLNESKNVTAICPVGVKPNGVRPNKLSIRIKKKIESNAGK